MNKIYRRFLANKAASISLLVFAGVALLALGAPWLAPFSPNAIHEGNYLLPPIWKTSVSTPYWLGTDDVGRDVLSRLLYGARVSLVVGCAVVFLSLMIGSTLGFLAGYFGGWVDSVISRLVDILMSLPSILLAIVMVAVLGPNLINGIFAVSLVSLPGFIRVARSAVLAEKNKSYVMAAQCFGASHSRILIKNILPNTLAPLIVQATLGFSDGILNVAALGFLGLGAQAPTPEWGVMLADSRAYIESASWLVTLPGVCILIVVVCLNLVGDGLRDAFDPRLKSG